MFHFRSLRTRIAFAYLLLIVGIMAGLTLFLTRQVRTVALENLQTDLLTETRLLATNRTLQEGLLLGRWTPGAPELDNLIDQWSDVLDVRVTLSAPDGTVLADSAADAHAMETHSDRPEIIEALSTGRGTSTRYSRTVGMETFYTAVAIERTGSEQEEPRLLGVLRLAIPVEQVAESVAPLRSIILVTSFLAIVLTGLLSLFIAERIARPVRRLTHMAVRMSRGNWESRIGPASQDEVGQLVRAFNRMADRLQMQMTSLTREQERLAAVLTSMADGVLILDDEGRVQLLNPAAARLLDLNAGRVQNHSIVQAVRDHRLVELWQHTQESLTQKETVLEMDQRVVRVLVTPFSEGSHRGYIIILQDLTRLRRLETVRRDFVSNISHELRTPLASLRALVETLRDGALDDPPAAQRFLDRIETEVDALAQMVQELLELSRIESGRVPLQIEQVPVSDLLLRPVERLQSQAERAGVHLAVDLPGRLPAVLADPERMHQVVINLIHNSIKFTPPGGSITVRAENDPAAPQVVISVADTGLGIAAEDLPRIFERFYKTDRSRAAGGTGLGLAISKHLVQAHGGQIWAESTEGEGSTFFFTLPAVKKQIIRA